MKAAHVERRYSQAEAAFRRLTSQPAGVSLIDFARQLRTPEAQAFSRAKAEQMTRITRRAQRMVREAQS